MVNQRDEKTPVPGQDRISELMQSMFTVKIEMTDTLLQLLTPDEKNRLAKKLERVIVPLTKDQCVGMARGTIKYPSDNYTPNQLMMHMMEEIRDQVNYDLTRRQFYGIIGRYRRRQCGFRRDIRVNATTAKERVCRQQDQKTW